MNITRAIYGEDLIAFYNAGFIVASDMPMERIDPLGWNVIERVLEKDYINNEFYQRYLILGKLIETNTPYPIMLSIKLDCEGTLIHSVYLSEERISN